MKKTTQCYLFPASLDPPNLESTRNKLNHRTLSNIHPKHITSHNNSIVNHTLASPPSCCTGVERVLLPAEEDTPAVTRSMLSSSDLLAEKKSRIVYQIHIRHKEKKNRTMPRREFQRETGRGPTPREGGGNSNNRGGRERGTSASLVLHCLSVRKTSA